MAIKPILFNTEMVRAILDGRKICTRRLVKLPSYIKQQEDGLYTLYAEGTCYENQYLEEIIEYIKQPYQSGDILYVRETWKKAPNGYYYYEDWQRNDIADITKWKPSIHMPKKAARIWLKVTDVKVERLQEITPDAIKNEGIILNPKEYVGKFDYTSELYFLFQRLWNSTIKKSDFDRYGWDANPWVWVIEFERCEKPEGV